MQQQLSAALRLLIPDIALFIRRDMDIAEPGLTVLNLGKAIFEIDTGGTDTLWRILNSADVVKRPTAPSSFRISNVFDNDGNPTDDLGIWFEWDDSEQ